MSDNFVSLLRDALEKYVEYVIIIKKAYDLNLYETQYISSTYNITLRVCNI